MSSQPRKKRFIRCTNIYDEDKCESVDNCQWKNKCIYKGDRDNRYVPTDLLDHPKLYQSWDVLSTILPEFIETETLADLYPSYPFDLFNAIIEKGSDIFDNSDKEFENLFIKINNNPQEYVIEEIFNIFMDLLHKNCYIMPSIIFPIIYYASILGNIDLIENKFKPIQLLYEKNINSVIDITDDTPVNITKIDMIIGMIVDGAILGDHLRLVEYAIYKYHDTLEITEENKFKSLLNHISSMADRYNRHDIIQYITELTGLNSAELYESAYESALESALATGHRYFNMFQYIVRYRNRNLYWTEN
jgi:hypothetical protein